MAEGDTILRAARRIAAGLEGEVLEVGAPSPRGRAAGVLRLDGCRLEEVRSHGKHLVMVFDELALHSHLGMNGSWHVYPRGARWRKPTHQAWVVLRGEREEAVQFNGPTLRVLAARQLPRDPKLRSLGPDILTEAFDPREVAPAFTGRQGSRGLGDLMLDQRLVAGIGNIFKSEACWQAKLDPWRRGRDLEPAEAVAALTAAREQMLACVEGAKRPRNVYKRRGEPCPRCGTRILARGQGDANRTTYWCPTCQS
jgi:endonuclease-8